MSLEFDFITTNDRPALLGISTVAVQEAVQNALNAMGFKVHTSANHGEFLHRYNQLQYQVAVLEETFSGSTLADNESLSTLQHFLMPLRRHCIVVLVGPSFATFNPLQAFQFGVHAVVNPNEIFLIQQVLEKAVSDNDLFLHTFRDSIRRLA